MNNHAETIADERSLASILAEMKEELKQFAETRIEMLKSELREKTARWKTAAPLVVIGGLLLITAYLLLTLALVAVIAVVFSSNPYHWALGFGIVGLLWGVLGATAIYIGIGEFRVHELTPRRTLEVLKGDKAWLQNEARSQV